ncbi:MAG TPA: hypothetical protein PKA41_16555 [Verrucomicrobiota bacterium]|nr:hypothetical protein [Verrucomicrobiota bacterium]
MKIEREHGNLENVPESNGAGALKVLTISVVLPADECGQQQKPLYET